MKKILFLTVGIFYSLVGISQQVTINLSDVVSINLPKEAEKLNKEQLIAYADKIFNISLIKLNPKNVYKFDDMLLSFYDAQSDFEETRINDIKNELDGWFSHAPHNTLNYKSVIKTINNNKVLTTRTIDKGQMCLPHLLALRQLRYSPN